MPPGGYLKVAGSNLTHMLRRTRTALATLAEVDLTRLHAISYDIS